MFHQPSVAAGDWFQDPQCIWQMLQSLALCPLQDAEHSLWEIGIWLFRGDFETSVLVLKGDFKVYLLDICIKMNTLDRNIRY